MDSQSAIPSEIHDDQSPTRRVTFEENLQLAAKAEIAEPFHETAGKRMLRKRQACLLDRAGWSAICGLSAADIRAYEVGDALLEPATLCMLERKLDSHIALLGVPDATQE